MARSGRLDLTIRFPGYLFRYAALALAVSGVRASDWPMWGYDASRSGASPAAEALPETLQLHWSRQLPAPRRAWARQWDDGDKLEFDLSYSPVVSGGRLFVASMTTDSLTAYDAGTGEELWRFYADGPMRVAPAAWAGRVYAASDDGRLYCLDAATGRPLWAHDAAPSGHRVLGNGRIISFWPVRGGPAILDGIVYFASGIWPFLGTSVHALDAETGAVVWENTGHAAEWQAQPHGDAYAFAGIAPQGYLAASGDRLVVSGGRTPPGLFDRRDGSSIPTSLRAKMPGGYRVRIQGDSFFDHSRRYRLSDGRGLGGGRIREGREHEALRARTASVQSQLDGPVFESLAAQGRLYVVTHSGRIHAFGEPRAAEPRRHAPAPGGPALRADGAGRTAESLLARLPGADRGGYGLFLGAADGDLIEQVALRSDLHLVAIEPDDAKRDALRRRFDEAGLYGPRVALLPGDPAEAAFPPHVARLVVLPDPAALGRDPDAAFLDRVYRHLMPYRGVAFLWTEPGGESAFERALAGFHPENGRAETVPGGVLLARTGPLPGSGEWTHQYADSAQTVFSPDDRVRPPFGPIWFGGPSHDNILPRHAAGPRPQVAGGRMLILGVETISARCVFTGRELWVREFPGIGHPFTNLELEERWARGESVYMTNQPGASFIGSPYVTLPDAVYLRYRGRVIRLDPETGRTVAEWPLPAQEPGGGGPDWGHISVSGDRVVATTDPHIFEGGALGTAGEDRWDASSSARLVALDRHTGRVAWVRDARIGFRHNAIVSAGGVLFVNDLLSERALDMARRRGIPVGDRARLHALDLDSGREIWTVESEVFGTFLSYCSERDILVEGGSSDGRVRLPDEPISSLIARRGRDGGVLWRRSGRYDGPVILRGDTLFPARAGAAVCLLTGDPATRPHPITGQPVPWTYTRTYGCGTANAGRHVMLFRSGSAGFLDFRDGSTFSLGGFRAGCTANLMPADGVLNAPDYTRTCTCSYQNQTSLALAHMPELEMWAMTRALGLPEGPIRRVGVNLGAPGDRLSPDGTLWVHVPETAPSVGLIARVLESGDAPETGGRVLAVAGEWRAGEWRPSNTLDGDMDTVWRISCRRTGRFNRALEFTLDRPVPIGRVRLAWNGPTETRYRIETSGEGGDWRTVYNGLGSGPGKVYETLEFEPVTARQVRIVFEEHGDDSEESPGRRHDRSLMVYQARIGGLSDPEAYAYFSPKNLFRMNALQVDAGGGANWIAASGVNGITQLRLVGVRGGGQGFSVTLHFLEPEPLLPGQRVFDIRIGDRVVARGFDVVREAGGPGRAATLEFEGVPLADEFVLTLEPVEGSAHPPVLSGVELIRGDERAAGGP